MRIIYLLSCAALLFETLAINSVHSMNITENTLAHVVSKAVCEKQVVVLGELPTHGEALGFQAKADIVQYLAEQCRFNTVFFEAPMYDFIGFQQALADDKAQQQQLNQAIGGFWQTQELAPWRQWLFNQAVKGKLNLAGLDDQVSASSVHARIILPHLLGSMAATENKATCQAALERNLHWRYDDQNQYGPAEMDLLQLCTQQAIDKLKNTPNAELSEQKMAVNLANLYARNNQAPNALTRDESMYHNFKWQHQNLPKDSKVIIWTATVHAARQQGDLKRKPMGVWLAEQWQNNMAVIGFTAYQGESSMAGMTIKAITAAPENSLEAKVTSDATDWVYLSAKDLSELGKISARLYGKFMTVNWHESFDGVVVFRQEQAPTFIER
jgi:erythromycin esterase-like protein